MKSTSDNKKIIFFTYRNFLISFLIPCILLGLTQLIFYLVNSSYFNLEQEKLSSILLGNFVFIMSACSMYLAPFILFSICPILSFKKIKYNPIRYFKNIFWILPTFLILILNLIDVFWYQTVGERSSWQHVDTFLAIVDKTGFIISCLKTYWPALLLTIIVIVLLGWFINSIDRSIKDKKLNYIISTKSLILEVFLMMVVIAVCAASIRGLTGSPLRTIHASKFVNFKNMDIVLNTPYIMIKTVGKKIIHRVNFFPDNELQSIFNPEKSYPSLKTSSDPDSLCLKKYAPQIKNIVLIQMESMGAEYLSSFNSGISYAPFLDSLIKKSITYQGWANGSLTKEAPISVVSSFPNYGAGGGNRSIIVSTHFHTSLHSIAQELKKLSYDTMFFFGDENGSQYLDIFALNSGFDHYYGMNEYNKAHPGNSDFIKGTLGITDGPFLEYSLETIDSIHKQSLKPFITYITTTTAHFPFLIPTEYDSILEPGPLPIHKAIRYADRALESFFKKAATMSWYNETMFILFADHTSLSQGGFWITDKGKRTIPIIFFIPSMSEDCHIFSSKLAQQVDIFPTLLDFFNIKTKIVSYGNSLMDKNHMDLGLFNDGKAHILQVEDYLIKCIDNCNQVELYNIKQDPLAKSNLYNNLDDDTTQKEKMINLVRFAKATIQQFTNRLIDGKTTVSSNDDSNK